jgi:hypothetical protein
VSWRLLGQYNAREHWTAYLLATASNLFLSVPLYIAARAGILALLPVTGSTRTFISSYGIGWGLALDFLWTMLVFQGLLAVLILAAAGTTLVQKGWKWFYVFVELLISAFVGYWLGTRFLQTLDWVSLLQSSGVETSGVYSDLFWYGLGATICYVAMILVLRRSYNRLTELKATWTIQETQHRDVPTPPS